MSLLYSRSSVPVISARIVKYDVSLQRCQHRTDYRMSADHCSKHYPSSRGLLHQKRSSHRGGYDCMPAYCNCCMVRSDLQLKWSMLQEFNPMPFAAMILNHTGWVVYAVLNTDWFIFSAESTGLLCGIWITFSLFPLSSEKVKATALKWSNSCPSLPYLLSGLPYSSTVSNLRRSWQCFMVTT